MRPQPIQPISAASSSRPKGKPSARPVSPPTATPSWVTSSITVTRTPPSTGRRLPPAPRTARICTTPSGWASANMSATCWCGVSETTRPDVVLSRTPFAPGTRSPKAASAKPSRNSTIWASSPKCGPRCRIPTAKRGSKARAVPVGRSQRYSFNVGWERNWRGVDQGQRDHQPMPVRARPGFSPRGFPPESAARMSAAWDTRSAYGHCLHPEQRGVEQLPDSSVHGQ